MTTRNDFHRASERLAQFGSPSTPAAVEAGRILLTCAEENGAEVPGVFPAEEEGVILEWSTTTRVISIEIGPEADLELFDLDVPSASAYDEETTDLERAKRFLKDRAPAKTAE